jgi:hypothetical protein
LELELKQNIRHFQQETEAIIELFQIQIPSETENLLESKLNKID